MQQGVSVSSDVRERRMVLSCATCDIDVLIDLRDGAAGLALMRFSLEHDHTTGEQRELELARLDLQLPPRR